MRSPSALVSLAMSAALAALAACGGGQGPAEAAPSVQLTFPFADSSPIIEAHNFALHPWNTDGETHSGIDIVPQYHDLAGTDGMRKHAIVAPADGTIQNYVEDVSGAGLASYFVVLQIDTYWHLMMVFEPQSENEATNREQRASLSGLQIGQTVQRGEVIADLVVSRVKEESYPHVHFGVFYKDPLESYETVYQTLRVHDGTTPSPGILETNLGIPSTFYCPYDYFLPAGRTVLDRVSKLDVLGNLCSCACSYGSDAGDCGACP